MTPRDELCRAVRAAWAEVFNLQLAAMMPGLSAGQLKLIKRQERVARERRRVVCARLQQDIRRRMPPVQLELPLPKPHI